MYFGLHTLKEKSQQDIDGNEHKQTQNDRRGLHDNYQDAAVNKDTLPHPGRREGRNDILVYIGELLNNMREEKVQKVTRMIGSDVESGRSQWQW